MDRNIMGPSFLYYIDSPFFIWYIMSDHVVEEDTNGPDLAFDIDDLGADFDFRGN